MFICDLGICFTQKLILNWVPSIVCGEVGRRQHWPSNCEFLGLGNDLVRTLANDKKKAPTKFWNYPCKLFKKKKSQQKEEEEMKYGIPEFRNRRKKWEAVSRKKGWLLKLMENLSIWKNPEGFASTCWISAWVCSNAFSEPWWSGGKRILEKYIKNLNSPLKLCCHNLISSKERGSWIWQFVQLILLTAGSQISTDSFIITGFCLSCALPP